MSNELMFKAALYCASNKGYIPEGRSFILNKDSGSIYSANPVYRIAANENVISNGRTLRTYVEDLFSEFPEEVYYIQDSSVSSYHYIGYNKDLSLRHINGIWEKMIYPTRSDVSDLIPRSLIDTRGTSEFPIGSWCMYKGAEGLRYVEGHAIDGSLIVGSGPDSDRFIKVSKSEFEPIDSETAALIHAMIEAEPKDTNDVMRMRRLMEVVLKYKGL